MIILTRKPSQSLVVQPHPSLAIGTPVEEVFAERSVQVQVLAVQESEVQLGVVTPSGFCVVREELRCLVLAVNPVPGELRWRLARKLKVLMILNHYSTQSLAIATGLAPARVLAAESGIGMITLDDLEKMARVLRVKVVELFIAPGRTAAERVVLGLLEGAEHKK